MRVERNLVALRPRPETVLVSHDQTVLATQRNGFLENVPEQGLFVHQTRLLSRYRLLIDGRPPHPVALSNINHNTWLGYYIAVPPGCDDGPANLVMPQPAAQHTIELQISRSLGGGMHEDLDLTNFTQRRVKFRLELEIDADFADQEESAGPRQQQGVTQRYSRTEGTVRVLVLDYRATHHYAHQGNEGTAHLHRAITLRIESATTEASIEDARVTFEVDLLPLGTWHVCLKWTPFIDGRSLPPPQDCRALIGLHQDSDARRALFLEEATRFTSAESETLAPVVIETLDQARRDLAGLRLHERDHGERAWTVAAGLPMYVALFGRDVLTAAWQAALLGPEVMRGSLPELARWQGTERNDWRDEQPGRMLHEAHTGPVKHLQFNPKARYYGSITTSGFFPFVVAQLWHWTADREAVAPLIDPAVRALKWLDTCDIDGDGFCEYQTRSTQGVENQGWKDSGDALVYEDGSQVPKPIATCEEQGIVYAAKLNFAEVLWWFDRKDEAKRLYREAVELKKRFNDAFWLPSQGFVAMALDPQKRPVRSIGSNPIHCIATGILDAEFVPQTLERLFAPDLFSGWGVRTLSSEHPAYNPYAYHRGTVWPVEHGPFAVGAYRYGCHDRVEQICRAQFELASLFDHHRLPECISGHPRDAAHPFPAIYPAANSPQAWSATTTFTLLQAMLGLQPFAPFRMLFVDPHLPVWLPQITLHHLRVADALVTIRFFRTDRGTSDYEVWSEHGTLHVIRQPSPWSLTANFGERLRDLLTSLLPGK